MMDNVIPFLVLLGSVIPSIFAYRGVKSNDSTNRLAKAAELYGDYADKIDARLKTVEEEAAELKTQNRDLTKSVEQLSKDVELYKSEASEYEREAKRYKEIINEVITRLTRIVNWDKTKSNEDRPIYTVAMVLDLLVNSMKTHNEDQL